MLPGVTVAPSHKVSGDCDSRTLCQFNRYVLSRLADGAPRNRCGEPLREMPTVTLNDFRGWFPYNVVAFIIPGHIRPATTSFMEAGWQTYISLCSHGYHSDGGVYNDVMQYA
jgi:hypothetical protein